MRLAALTLLLLATPVASQAKQETRVRLVVGNGWTQETVTKFQPLADQTAHLVDELIPGPSQDYPANGVVCFEAPQRWKEPKWSEAGNAAPPVTIAGGREDDEPVGTHGDEVRIALDLGTNPDFDKFVFQLSHELTHVKMGHRTDNFLDETFAVALSFEALLRLGQGANILQNEAFYMVRLPAPTLDALARGRWNDLRTYWLQTLQAYSLKTPAPREQLSARDSQMAGATLMLHESPVPWHELLGVTSTNTCAAEVAANGFKVCPPDISRMGQQRSLLKPLGLTPE